MKKKTAGIYDRWLSTLGGGEQVAFAYAQALHELGYSVSLITHKKVDVKKAENKMGISLKEINIKYLPEASSETLSGVSEKYDLFINTSHLDYFANRSKQGFLSVFFPGLLNLAPFEYIKRAFFIPSFRKLFIYPSRYEGFKFDQHIGRRIFKWLSEESSIVFIDRIKKFKIRLYFADFTFSVVDEIKFFLDNEQVFPSDRSTKEKDNIVSYVFENLDTKNKRFTIELPPNEYSENVALISLTIFSFRYFLYNLFKKAFPVWEMRLHGGPGVTKKSDLLSYNKIITISEFCKLWIKKYWGLNSEVLYPPVNTKKFSPAKNKKNIILHVGRFFIKGHSKKQLEMVQAFTRMHNKKMLKNWELHFVGSVEDGEVHQNFFKRVKNEGSGYPVFFHNDVSFKELQKLFSEAKIYWHATGFGENESKYPLRFEHFGITTVEAMASGCVPIVINAGGQKEIVNKNCGYKWEKISELMSFTNKVATNPKLFNKMSKAAIKRSKEFSKESFKKRFKKIIVES